ncbi:MAG TPA: DNA polymerase III subunit delta [Burkholderiales bacterium]|nr:DNA polymerase III subunit delta [Burkholderiales bacterium]
MRIDSGQLQQNLKRGLSPLYVVFGEEMLLGLEAADRIRAAVSAAGYTERRILIVEPGFDWRALAQAGSNLSLFGSKLLIDLRIPSGKPGRDGADALLAASQALAPDCVTLITLPALDRQTQTSRWFEALERAGVAVHAAAVTRERLPQWIAQRLAQQDQRAADETLAFLAERVEGNLMAAHQEVQKLALLFPPGELPFEAVRSAVLNVARYDVFELGAAILRGERAQFLRVLDGLRAEGVAPPLALWAIAEEARAMAWVGAATERGLPMAQALREARVWGVRQQLMPRALPGLDRPRVLAALARAAEIDRMIKGLSRSDVWDALLALGLSLMPAGQARQRGIGGRIPRSPRAES